MTRSLRAARWLLPLVLLSCHGDALEWEIPRARDRGWWDGFATQGTDDHVLALASHDSLLIAGGYFLHAGGVAASCVAAWDGAAWHPLGSGLRRDDCPGPRCDAWVAACTTFEGALIAGGRFTEAGGVRAANVARWDGNAWSALGEGLDGTVLALAVEGGRLVAGGEFAGSGTDSTVHRVAAWDGTRWQALGGGANAIVRALLHTADGLLVGGDFTVVGTDSLAFVARWTGLQWSSLPPLGGPVYGLCELQRDAETELFACGRRLQYGDAREGLMLRRGNVWEDVYWRYYPLYPNALATLNGSLIVGGDLSYDESRANGVARILAPDFNAYPMAGGVWGQVFALCVHQGHLYVGGRFEVAGDQPSPHIARWDE